MLPWIRHALHELQREYDHAAKLFEEADLAAVLAANKADHARRRLATTQQALEKLTDLSRSLEQGGAS